MSDSVSKCQDVDISARDENRSGSPAFAHQDLQLEEEFYIEEIRYSDDEPESLSDNAGLPSEATDINNDELGFSVKDEPEDYTGYCEGGQMAMQIKCEISDSDNDSDLGTFLKQTTSFVPVQDGIRPKRKPKKRNRKKLSELPRIFQCDKCQKSYSDKGVLNRHMKTVHDPDRPHPSELPRPHQCPMCPKAYPTKPLLNRHIKSHTRPHISQLPRPFQCNICQKTYTEKALLKRHMKIHFKQKPDPNEIPELFDCNICSKSYTTKNSLRRHMKLHTEEKPEIPEKFECYICPRKYSSRNALTRHMKTHQGYVDYRHTKSL